MKTTWVIGFALVTALAALLHWAAWRWLARMAPRWIERGRPWKLATLLLLFSLPLARVLSFLDVRSSIGSKVAAWGQLWHLALAMTMVVIAIFWVGRGAHAALARRNTPPPVEPAVNIDRRQALERAVGATAF